MQSFLDYLKEAKELNEADTQKASENKDLANKDASHGDKAEVLPTTVKADGNNYEGDKPDVLDKKINESECEDDDKKKDDQEDEEDQEDQEKLKESMALNEKVTEIGTKLMVSPSGRGGIQIAVFDNKGDKWVYVSLSKPEYENFKDALPK